MGLIDGLSDWLRQIIAVVLLASLIDLLLPNRTMQKYVRLVAGLFILMTVSTPILHWMKGDFSNKLAESLNIVEQAPQGAADELAMIEEEGARLRDKQNVQAADLVSTRLEAAIRSEVEQSENRTVRNVKVVTEKDKGGSLTVTQVIVLLDLEQQVAADQSHNQSIVNDVNPIAAVDINIEVESWPSNDETASASAVKTDQAAAVEEDDTDTDTRLRISALIASRFGLSANIVQVKQTAMGPANSN
jgi:stage III sporulation protein AF